MFSVTYPEFYFVSNKTNEGYLSPVFVKEFVEAFHPDICIETGTYSGQTALNVAPFFRQVHTIELSQVLYEKAKEKLSSLANITVYHGNSAELFKSLIPICKGTVLFWLDAHYSGGSTALSNSDPDSANAVTAIREELQAIAQSGLTHCLIMVDDIRGFGSVIDTTEFLGCWAYPSIQEVCDLGRAINKNFDFVLLGDTLLMYDKTVYSPNFSPVVRACTKSRLYDGRNYSEQELTESEHIIMACATNAERDFIKNLYAFMTPCKDPLFHHDLWHALICMGLNDWKGAMSALNKVPERVEFLNKYKQSVNNIVRYNPSRFEHYFKVIENNIRG